jgi:heat shock protein HtpX
MVIAAVFFGVISLVGDLSFVRRAIQSSGRSSSSRRSSGRGGGGALILILIAIAIFIIARAGHRAQLHVAKARVPRRCGSVELTKNPDAMISAFRKVAAI